MDKILSMQKMQAPSALYDAMISTMSFGCSSAGNVAGCGPVHTDPGGAI